MTTQISDLSQLRHVFMALTNVKPGREADFREWYDTEHVPDVVAVPCYRSGRRFRLFGTVGSEGPWEYLSLYRFLGSVPEMHELLKETGRAANRTMTDALVDDDGAWVFTRIND